MDQPPRRTFHVVVMGVAGTGKSTVASRLAEDLNLHFVEGDDHHPAVNIEKMAAGTPLTDDDRKPWLEELSAIIAGCELAGRSSVVTCSALRRTYRDILRMGAAPGRVFFLHLHGSFEVLEQRMKLREKHFMPTSLLRSQFETLEPLAAHEQGAVVDVAPDLDTVIGQALAAVTAWAASAD